MLKIGDNVAVKGRIGAGKRGVIVQQGPATIPWERGTIKVGRDYYKVQFDRRQTRWLPAENLEIAMDAKTRREVVAVLIKQGRKDLARIVAGRGPAWGLGNKVAQLPPAQRNKILTKNARKVGANAMLEAIAGEKAVYSFGALVHDFYAAIDEKRLAQAIESTVGVLEDEGALD